MYPCVLVRVGDGAIHTLGPGDLIGRNPNAALIFDDASVSEAHALVSLREGGFRLLGLRGAFSVGDDPTPQKECALERGMVLRLSKEVEITVHEVRLPDQSVGLAGPGLMHQVLASVGSLVEGPGGQIQYVNRFRAEALAHIWSLGDQWQLRVGDGEPTEIGVGQGFTVAGRRYRMVPIGRAGAAHRATQLEGGVEEPLKVVAHYDSVRIERKTQPAVVLTHTAARIVSELVQIGEPCHWEVVAREVWPKEQEPSVLRGRWDVSLRRLRRRLSAVGIRPDLVSIDAGTIRLALNAGDQVEDHS